jgi:hypothetical protein
MESAPTITSLRKKVEAATEEFEAAMQFHEAWKPAARDAALHRRVSSSYAGHTFLVVRRALEREMLMAMMRMWDTNSESLRVKNIANILRHKPVVDALVEECKSQWPPHDAFGAEKGEEVRNRAGEAVAIVDKYSEDGACHTTLDALRQLRNEYLAHRQLDRTAIIRMADRDGQIEGFYQDMSSLIEHLRIVALNAGYNLTEAAQIHSRNAKFFWDSVRGEGVEDTPNRNDD